jgi:ketosteroid isomerase-like protein
MQQPLDVPQSLVDELVHAFEHLQATDIARMGDWYDEQARFKDPFNEVQGVDAVRGIFQHMYDSLNQPRFIVTARVVQGHQCFLTWDFVFGIRGQSSEITVRGASHLWLAPGTDGRWRIQRHRDYWDVAEELYEKLPLLGALMRWLKRQAG